MNDPHIRVPKERKVRIHQEGAEVVLLIDGRVAFQSHWRYVIELADGLRDRARAAKQFEDAAAGKTPGQVVSVFGIPLFRRKS